MRSKRILLQVHLGEDSAEVKVGRRLPEALIVRGGGPQKRPIPKNPVAAWVATAKTACEQDQGVQKNL